MARIAGVDIPRDKRVEISLTYIYGIGLTTSRKILERTRIDPDIWVKNLTEEEVNRLRDRLRCALQHVRPSHRGWQLVSAGHGSL